MIPILWLKRSVTPFVGVWIETPVSWEHEYQWYVTPFVGVWIETFARYNSIDDLFVTPFVGVWIETRYASSQDLPLGHTLRGCVD